MKKSGSKNKAALIEVDRALVARGGFREFIPLAWPIVEPSHPFVGNWHIDVIAEYMQAVKVAEVRNLVINVPPGCMKSLLVGVLWHPWVWVDSPAHRILEASYDISLTRRDAEKSLNVLRSEWFTERWGNLVEEGVSVGDYKNSSGGFRFSTSIEGKATGRHVDTAIIDDPVKPQDISKNTIDAAKQWFRETLPTRFYDHKTRRIVIIMQRLHVEDIAGIAIEQGFECLKLPMRYEPKTSWCRDPRTEEGELLWPARFPEEAVQSLEKSLSPRAVAAQLQQRPTPEGGTIFEREWLQRWEVLPEKFDQIVQSWDCTFKGGKDSDFVVGQVWGRCGARFYLLDQIRKRMGFADTLASVRLMKVKHPKIGATLIEDAANGSAIYETLSREIHGVIACKPQGGKEARANAVSHLFAAKNVFFSPAGWCDQLVEELIAFPNGANDDQVDACTQALIYMQGHANRFLEAMKAIDLKLLRTA